MEYVTYPLLTFCVMYTVVDITRCAFRQWKTRNLPDPPGRISR